MRATYRVIALDALRHRGRRDNRVHLSITSKDEACTIGM